MFTEELQFKYLNHQNKSKAYDIAVFSGLYDRFLSLFTGFNMLYNEIPEILKYRGVTGFVENDNQPAFSPHPN